MSLDITRALRAIEAGDPKATESLLPLVYDELRRLAAHRMAEERPGATLQATALVHEAYLRLIGGGDGRSAPAAKWSGSGHFFAAAAEAMRRILVERARARGARKRGGERRRVTLDANALVIDPVPDELLDLDDALSRLAEEDPRKARLVELRFFAGLSLAEAAAILSVSNATADRDWAYARAWLHAELSRGSESDSSRKE